MSISRLGLTVSLVAIALPCTLLPAQSTSRVVAPAPIVASSASTVPSSAPRQARPLVTFHDPNYKISFDYPADWTFTRKDREISTFHLDARSAPRTATLRAVAAIPENPYPASTFSGAYVYLSVTPHSSDALCSRQAVAPESAAGKRTVSQIAGVSFAHGHDEQKNICTTERDEIYTTFRRGSCYRFDLAMNNFCGGQVSGVKDISEQELEDIRTRMEAILATVRFDPK